jgi:nitrile hydratase beta subunit
MPGIDASFKRSAKTWGNWILNGVHDIGGMDGFGAIQRETNEPVFHEPWESRVFGMFLTGAGMPPQPLDAGRHRLERLDPVKYLSSSYYERWLAMMESALIETGTLSQNEIEARVQQFAAAPDLPVPRREDPARAERIANVFRAGRPATRTIRPKPHFAIGDKIVTRNHNPHGHTRLPRYARGKHGVIVAHHGAHVFPDANAHGLGENPQHLYTVRIAMRELWGGDAEPNESVLIDLWESYLEKDKAAAKSTTRETTPAAKKIAAKTPSRSVNVLAHAASSKRSPGKPLPSATRASPPAQKSKRGTGTMPSSTGKVEKSSKGSTAGGRDSARSGRGSGKPMRRSR